MVIFCHCFDSGYLDPAEPASRLAEIGENMVFKLRAVDQPRHLTATATKDEAAFTKDEPSP